MSLVTGTQFDRYEVRSLIGSGGMGEVYLARDVHLGRQVALKVLLEKFTASKGHLRRFEQEARATSALNHPNILTIHEIGQVDSTYFIATEFVEGKTLRQVISGSELGLAKAVDIAIQISSGLAAAHAAGIIHRDIKPENIMLREDGYVKILDFGLAKLIEDQLLSHPVTLNESTLPNVETLSGAIVGTLRYMSPEQLRGLPVDARSDIWSLGVVLYEMVAGRAPFRGNSNADVIVTVLEKEPSPVTDYLSDGPPLLADIIHKTLAKDKGERYRTVNDLQVDLKLLSEELHGEPRWREQQTLQLRPGVSGSRASKDVSARSASRGSVTQAVSEHRWLVPGLFVALAVLLGSYGVYRLLRTASPPPAKVSPYQDATLTKLGDTGRATDGVISPDGKYIVYSMDDGGKQSLWLRQVIGGTGVLIIPAGDVRYSGMTFSPDSNYIYYVAFEKDANVGRLFRIPLLGVTPKKIIEDVDAPVSFSPDGTQIAFVRGYPSRKQTALMIASADGSGERQLAVRQSPDDFGWKGGPAWSPDGEQIACAVGTYDLKMHLVAVNVRDGSEKVILSGKWPWIGRVVWLRDGSGLLMVARNDSTDFRQIWYVGYPSSQLQRITGDLDEFGARSLSATADSQRVLLVETEYLSNIWISPNGDERRSKQIGNGRSDGFNGLSWTPDDKIVYTSRANGSLDIWIMDREGAKPKQLTFESGSNYHPTVTHDGQFIVFTSTRAGGQDLWRMDIDGSNAKQLTKDANASWPSCSPDGKSVVYKTYKSGKRTLWKVNIDGGPSQQITDKYMGSPAVSPDGKMIACDYWDEQMGSQFQLAIVSSDSGTPVKTLNWRPDPALALYIPPVIRWMPDGRAVSYSDNHTSAGNIWTQSLNEESPRQVTGFQTQKIFWFDWSADGKQIATSRGVTVRDVVMITRAKH